MLDCPMNSVEFFAMGVGGDLSIIVMPLLRVIVNVYTTAFPHPNAKERCGRTRQEERGGGGGGERERWEQEDGKGKRMLRRTGRGWWREEGNEPAEERGEAGRGTVERGGPQG